VATLRLFLRTRRALQQLQKSQAERQDELSEITLSLCRLDVSNRLSYQNDRYCRTQCDIRQVEGAMHRGNRAVQHCTIQTLAARCRRFEISRLEVVGRSA
jgi:hypothetical protein